MQQKREMILNGSIYKVLIKLSIPIMINSLIQTLYNLVDGMYVSQISSVHFAATSLVWPVNSLFVSLGIGLSIAGTSLVSQLIGAGKEKEASEYSTQIISLTMAASVVLMALGYIFSPWIIKMMGGTGELAILSNQYLRITFLDIPFMFLFFNVNSIMVAQGNTLLPTILSGISAIINCVLDPIFIFESSFGIEGFGLNMGIAGAAWATLIAKAVLALWAFAYLYTKNSRIKPSFKGFKFNKSIVKQVVRVGIPSSIGQSGSSLGFIVLNGFINSYGTATLAAFAMVNRVTSLIMQPAMGIGSALTAVVGQNIGANQVDRAKEGFNKALRMTIVVGVVGAIALMIFDEEIITFFMQSKDDYSVIELGLVYLFYISFSMPLMGVFSVLQGLFQGSGNTKYSMTMEIGRLWFVRIPMILLFKYFTNWGSSGIWFSMSFSNLIVCLYGYTIYRMGGWQKKVIANMDTEENL